MKLWFLPVHIETPGTYFAKLKAAKELGKVEQNKINIRQITQLIDENARMRLGRKLPK